MRSSSSIALGFVEAVEHLLADVDAEQRRHRDEHVARLARAPESASGTARTAASRCAGRRNRRRRGCRPCRSAGRRDRPCRDRSRSRRRGRALPAMRARSAGFDFPGVQDLAAQRQDRLEISCRAPASRSRRPNRLRPGTAPCIARSCDVQSASLPGSAGPCVIFLRTTCFACLEPDRRASRSRAARSRRRISTCWFSQSEKRVVRRAARRIPPQSREDRRSLVWPENCGSVIFSDSTKRSRSQTSSGASLMPRGSRLRNSQNSRSASVRPERRPLTCVPPCDRRDQVDVALLRRARRRAARRAPNRRLASSRSSCAGERDRAAASRAPPSFERR